MSILDNWLRPAGPPAEATVNELQMRLMASLAQTKLRLDSFANAKQTAGELDDDSSGSDTEDDEEKQAQVPSHRMYNLAVQKQQRQQHQYHHQQPNRNDVRPIDQLNQNELVFHQTFQRPQKSALLTAQHQQQTYVPIDPFQSQLHVFHHVSVYPSAVPYNPKQSQSFASLHPATVQEWLASDGHNARRFNALHKPLDLASNVSGQHQESEYSAGLHLENREMHERQSPSQQNPRMQMNLADALKSIGEEAFKPLQLGKVSDLFNKKRERSVKENHPDEDKSLEEPLPKHRKAESACEADGLEPLEPSAHDEALLSQISKKESSHPLRFTCTYPGCNRRFAWNWTMETHARTHMGDAGRTFVCEICNKGFFTVGCLRSHANTHIRKKDSFPCKEEGCTKTYSTSEGLNLHIRNLHQKSKEYECPQDGCQRKFVRQADLKLHVVRMHCIEKPFPCSVPDCSKSFACLSELRRHLRFHKQNNFAIAALDAVGAVGKERPR